MVLEFSPDLLNAFSKGKSVETVKTYRSMLAKMFRELWNTQKFSLDKLKDFNKVRDYITKGKLSVTSKKIITIATVMILKAIKSPQSLIDQYGKLAKQYRLEDAAMRKDRIPTDRERMALMDWDQIVEVRQVYGDCLKDVVCKSEMTESEYRRWYAKYVTLCLFTMIPPQRGQVFYNCYIDKDVPGSNIFDTKAKQLIVRNEKTTRTYGIRTVPVPAELNNIVKTWKNVIGPPNLLIPNSHNKMMTSPGWTQFMKSIFDGRDISTDMIRKIYITHMISEKGISMEERRKMAELMGHSPTIQQHGYFKSDW